MITWNHPPNQTPTIEAKDFHSNLIHLKAPYIFYDHWLTDWMNIMYRQFWRNCFSRYWSCCWRDQRRSSDIIWKQVVHFNSSHAGGAPFEHNHGVPSEALEHEEVDEGIVGSGGLGKQAGHHSVSLWNVLKHWYCSLQAGMIVCIS